MEPDAQTTLSDMMISMKETHERLKIKESRFDEKQKKFEEREYDVAKREKDVNEREYDVAKRENNVTEREKNVERRENSLEERLNNVAESETRCVASTRKLQLQQDDVKERSLMLKNFELELESKEQELCMHQDDFQRKLDTLAQQELLLNEKMAAVVSKNMARVAELNPEIKTAAKQLEMMEDHLKFLKKQLNEKNDEVKQMEIAASKVKFLTVLKSEACKISAEVKELVLSATENVDKTLEALAMNDKLKLFREMIQVIGEFAEKLKNQKLQVDLKEGRTLATFESMSKLSSELDEKVLKLEAAVKEHDLQIKKQEKLEKVLKKDYENIRIGIAQIAKDQLSWRRKVTEQNMNELEEIYGGMARDAKLFVGCCRIPPR